MLYLTTGTPGAGKTLWTIATVEARRKAENRPVYYYNIRGLKLDWTLLTTEQVLKWWELPPGSIIVIDEAQDIFPKGSNAQKPPEHADRIAKHRHGGFDIYLVTQHPMKIDANVRKDVEEHRHLMRKFGTAWSTVHLWKGVRENCDKTRKDSIPTQWRYPKAFFDEYESAEVHTVRVRVPMQVWLLVLVPLFIALCAWWVFWGREARYKKDEPAQVTQAAPVRQAAPAQTRSAPGGAPGREQLPPMTPAELAQSFQPRIEGLPFTAPRYDELSKPVRIPVVVGCWQTVSKSEGWCITQQGNRIKPSPMFMASYLANGQFTDFEPGPRLGDEARQEGQPQSGPNRTHQAGAL